MPEENNGFKQWAVLELMGHRRLGGLVTETLIAGSPFIRIDIHIREFEGESGDKITTQFYSPASVYSIIPVGQAEARAVAAYNRQEPVYPYEVRQITAPDPSASEPEEN